MSRSFALPLLCLAALSGAASAADPFQATTPGKAGGGGLVPELSGFGTGMTGSANVLQLEQAAAGASATLVVGLSELALPFKGGVLGPAPDILVPGLLTDGQGRLALPFALPDGAPVGLTAWTQCWIVDPAASAGLSASNTVAFTVQLAPAPLYDAGAALTTASPGGPTGATVGDFDSDGVLDVAVNSLDEDAVIVLKGQGDGTFAAAPLGSVPNPGTLFTAADFDGDGHLDLATAGSLADIVAVWLGVGDGTFVAGQTYPGGDIAVDIITADVDEDGTPDLVTADGAGTVTIHRGRGGGTFYPAVSHAVGFNPTHVAVGDLDGDGMPDLAVSHNASFGRVALLFAEGGGAYSEPELLFVGALPEGLVIEDFDGDGAQDIAVCHTASADVRVLLGLGGGAFAPATAYAMPPGSQPRSLACADLDGDGALDLVASRFSALSVLRGTGNGAFFPEQPLTVIGNLRWSLAIADLDGDDAPDLVTARLMQDEIVTLLQP